MTTYVYELATSLDERWQEVNILIQKASEEENSNQGLYDALCRATVLLIVAHFESFLKETTRAIIRDINTFSTFSKSPMAFKRTFCKVFIDPNDGDFKEAELKTQKLIGILDGLDTKFSFESFLVETAYGNNKNPSPSMITKISTNFGVRNVFSWLYSQKIDIVFNGVRSEIEALIAELREHVIGNTENYPYSLNIARFEIAEPNSKSNPTARSFWETFLDDLMKSRNDIAHGSTLKNSLSIRDLVDFRDKVIILEYSFLLILCHKSRPTS